MTIIKTDNLDALLSIEDFDINTEVDDNNLLHLCAMYNAHDIAKYLLEQGFDTSLLNADDQSSLELTIINSSKEVFDLLVNNNVLSGNRPLYYALNNQNNYYLESLLNLGISYDDDSIELLRNDSEKLNTVKDILDSESEEALLKILFGEDDNKEYASNGTSSNSNTSSRNSSSNNNNKSENNVDNNNDNDNNDDEDEEEEEDKYLNITNTPSNSAQVMEYYEYIPTIDTDSTKVVTYEINNIPDGLEFSTTTGKLSGTPYYNQDGSFNDIKITASNDEVSNDIEFDLLIDISMIEKAMETGDPTLIDNSDILERTDYLSESSSKTCSEVGDVLYGENYVPMTFTGGNTNWATGLTSGNVNHIDLLGSTSGKSYAYLGENNSSKYVVSGVMIFQTHMGNDLYNSNLSENIFKLVTNDNDFFTNEKLVYTNKASVIADYLTNKNIDNNLTFTTDINNPDIDLFYYYSPSATIVNTAFERNIPIVTSYNRWWGNNSSHNLFDISLQWVGGVSALNDFSSYKEHCNSINSFERLIETFDNNSLNLINKSDVCTTSVGKTSCNFNTLENDSGESLNYLIGNEISSISSALSTYDRNGKNVFDDEKSEKLKLALLLADLYREEVSYPLNHTNGDDNLFYQAYYSDYVINYARDNNIAQTDLGNFASDMEVIDELELENANVVISPVENSDTYTTGYYLKPGQELVIRRSDDSATYSAVRLNTQRPGNGRIWDSGDAYKRPYLIRSNEVELTTSKEVRISSPHGGNIYIVAEGKRDEIDLEFENVLSYPTLTNFDNTSVQEYVTSLQTTPFKYTDMSTPYASIHSLTSKMIEGFEDYAENETQYIDDINDYIIKENYLYAGFEDSAIGELDSSVKTYFENLGLDDYNNPDIHRLPKRQHINVDYKSLCGSLCSGNPFDTSGRLKPIGWGESHEMGHNLQIAHLKIYSGRSTEVSNNIFPVNTIRTYAIDSGEDTYYYRSADAFVTLFNKSNEVHVNGGDASSNNWLWQGTGVYDNAFDRLNVYMQMMYAAEDYEVYTKMYIASRLVNNYNNSDATWDMYKDELGFSTYSRSEADSIDGNDFIAITLSYYSDKNTIEFLEGFGVSISDKAKDQIIANNPSETLGAGMYYVETDNEGKIPVALPTEFIEFGVGQEYSN